MTTAEMVEKDELIGQYTAEFPYLTIASESGKSSWAIGALNIRKELHRLFPETKFRTVSKVFSGGCSINVKWENGPQRPEVERIVKKYQYGGFDSMTDCSYCLDNPWSDLFGGAKYVMCHREETAQETGEVEEETQVIAECAGETLAVTTGDGEGIVRISQPLDGEGVKASAYCCGCGKGLEGRGKWYCSPDCKHEARSSGVRYCWNCGKQISKGLVCEDC